MRRANNILSAQTLLHDFFKVIKLETLIERRDTFLLCVKMRFSLVINQDKASLIPPYGNHLAGTRFNPLGTNRVLIILDLETSS